MLYREAAVAYGEALSEDSMFALAHYRKSIAADWVDAYTARTDADRAYRFRDALPERDQALVESLWLRRYGRVVDSEQAYRALLHQYPDDVEALIQLGELYFHDNPRRGRSIRESMEPFRRALELEPANPIAQVHVARVYALSDSLPLLGEASDLLQRLAPDSERALEVLALHGHLDDDAQAQARVKEELRHRPWYYTFHTVHGVARFARDPHGAIDLLDARPSDDPLLLSLVPNQLIVTGRYAEARDFLDRRRLQRDATWNMFQASPTPFFASAAWGVAARNGASPSSSGRVPERVRRRGRSRSPGRGADTEHGRRHVGCFLSTSAVRGGRVNSTY